MMLQTTRGSKNVPEGAVRLTEQQALSFQKAVIRDWKNELDVFFLRYGRHLACSSVFFTSILSWNHFRSVLGLGKRGKFYMSVPGTGFPVMLTWVFFDKYVTDKVLVMKSKCPLCQQLTYGMLQASQGLVYPVIVGALAGCGLASLHKTYNVPEVYKNPRDLFKFYYTLIKPGALKFQAIGVFHLFLALLLPYLQSKELVNVMRNLEKMEYNENLES